MSPKSQAKVDKEPITEDIDQDELQQLLDLSEQTSLKQLYARQYLKERVRRWIEARRRPDCQ